MFLSTDLTCEMNTDKTLTVTNRRAAIRTQKLSHTDLTEGYDLKSDGALLF